MTPAVNPTAHTSAETGTATRPSAAVLAQMFEPVRDDLREVEREFARHVQSQVDVIPTIGNYVKDSGGKRIRPAVLLMAARMAGYRGDRAVLYASVIEFIHTATLVHDDIIDEADVETNLRHPLVMIGSDGIPDLRGKPHPRLYGTMPRVLGEYVSERGVLPLEEAVRRMTSLPCERFGLARRGRIADGWWADLVLFDPATIRDTATYDDPQREPVGVELVVVNGQVAYDHGRHTDVGAGRLLRYRDESLP